MLRADVLNRLAIAPRLSPDLTVYEKNVGCGVGVGRTKDGVGLGPAGVGTGVGVGGGVPPARRGVGGSGCHAAPMTGSAPAPGRPLAPGLAPHATPPARTARWTVRR